MWKSSKYNKNIFIILTKNSDKQFILKPSKLVTETPGLDQCWSIFLGGSVMLALAGLVSAACHCFLWVITVSQTFSPAQDSLLGENIVTFFFLYSLPLFWKGRKKEIWPSERFRDYFYWNICYFNFTLSINHNPQLISTTHRRRLIQKRRQRSSLLFGDRIDSIPCCTTNLAPGWFEEMDK